MTEAEDADSDETDVSDADEVDEGSEADKYFNLFVESDAIDWDGLAATDPGARPAIDALAKIDSIRTAYLKVRVPEPGGAEDGNPRKEGESAASRDGARAQTPDLQRVGPYEVMEKIGRGGFATIYRAFDEKTRREVALKILDSRREMTGEVVARFLREARALALLRHDNIVRIYHVIDQTDTLGLCMELISGKSLKDYLAERGTLTPEEVASIAADLASALAQVHSAGFIHRDVKAENVMREDTGRIVLMDFGISRSMHPSSRLTATGVIVGTPLVLAPEQYEFKDIDRRTDIYALGCLLYRLLTGHYPVIGTSMEEIRRKVLEADYPRIRELRPEVPSSLEGLVAKAMDRNPDKRFESAEIMEAEFRGWLERRAASSRARSRRPSLTVVVLLVAILASLIAILAILLTRE